jgi:hypothetical protein
MRIRRVVRALFDNLDMLSAEDIASSEMLKALLSENVPTSIKRAYALGSDHASIFEINDSESYVEIHKSQWVPALETIISWYSDESVQDYEKCVELSKLIQEITSDKKKASKKSSKNKNSGKTGVQSS